MERMMTQPKYDLNHGVDLSVQYVTNAKGTLSLMDDMWVERGSLADWNVLEALHYKATNLPAGARYWRCVTSDGDLVGVVCTSSVALLLGSRHELLPKLKPSGGDNNITNVLRGKWLNANMRRDARIVTDTLYRGVGISYRMVNLANRLEGFRYIEIQSSMSKFNPFDVKAGFKHARLRHSNAYHQGVKLFRAWFDSHPADQQSVLAEWEAMPETVKPKILSDFQEFYFRHSAKVKTGANMKAKIDDAVRGMGFYALLKELQQLVFASPVYGLWLNPDLGVKLPDRLPLSAFDLQKTNEPLRLDLL
jgi:ABC-type ATPase with predicted acetyltransferase domain